MIRFFTIFIVVTFAACTCMANAQGGKIWLSRKELTKEMFGILLTGTVNGVPWQECISPDGETRYMIAGTDPKPGRMHITEAARACFNYGQGDDCFEVERRGENYAFHSDGQTSGLVFETTQVRRGITTCQRPEMS